MAKRHSKWTGPIAEAILSVEQRDGRNKAKRKDIHEWLMKNRPELYFSVNTSKRTIQSYLQKEKYGFISVFGKEKGKGYYTFDSNASDAPSIQFAIKRKDENLGPIDHHFSVQLTSDLIRVQLKPKGGGYNEESHLGIVRFFTNLREQDLVVRRILWDSKTARKMPNESSRALRISWPDDLDNLGSQGFRKKIGGQLQEYGGGNQAAILIEIVAPDPNLWIMDAVQLLGGQIRVSEKLSTPARMQEFRERPSRTASHLRSLARSTRISTGSGPVSLTHMATRPEAPVCWLGRSIDADGSHACV